MGNKATTPRAGGAGGGATGVPQFSAIPDHYESLEQVTEALRAAGVEGCSVAIGIDFTVSNVANGKASYGQSLHAVGGGGAKNPYQQVISVCSTVLRDFDDDGLIPTFGFGAKTNGGALFDIRPDGAPCAGVDGVLRDYEAALQRVELAAPTNFAPFLNRVADLVERGGGMHLALVITDGEVTPDSDYSSCTTDTKRAIVRCSKLPIAIVIVGVGDADFSKMEEFDDAKLAADHTRDCVQFVNFNTVMRHARRGYEEVDFSLAALQELPATYAHIRAAGLLDDD